jgi:methylenetetrahydrofolate dehydrogenase (NADP+)/methenyltetrahydrofolate cyclohydrolase
VEILKLPETVSVAEIIDQIKILNLSPKVNGIMVQLPLPFGPGETDQVLRTIDPKKDVDGMRLGSFFTAPVVLACLHTLKDGGATPASLVGIVGVEGFVGQRLCQILVNQNYKIVKVDEGELNNQVLQNCEVVISATGQVGLIKAEMVKDGVVAIDCGAPKAEFEERVYQKASFYTPVPGGIGPLTVAYLLSNLVKD